MCTLPNVPFDTPNNELSISLEAGSYPICFGCISNGSTCAVQLDEINLLRGALSSFVSSVHCLHLRLCDRCIDWTSQSGRADSCSENLVWESRVI